MAPREPVLVIAEAGVNHNGKLDLAMDLVDVAVTSGADIVKFQIFVPEEVISSRAAKADYQRRTTDVDESQLDMVRKLHLDHDSFIAIERRCREKKIAFLATPFDLPSLDFLTETLGADTIKLPSGEITNAPFLFAAAAKRRQIIVSTGMATLDEVETALGVLALGLTAGTQTPSIAACRAAFACAAGRAALAKHVTLLQCTTEYPAPFEDANLSAMQTLRDAFGLRVGFSDHTPGIAASIASVAFGACIIEKHFTLSCGLPGPDHKASLEPDQLKAMVDGIRAVERAVGDGIKAPRPSEVANIAIARRSLVAARPIKRGERLDASNLAVKRPGGGVSPMEYWAYLGRLAVRDYDRDDQIDD